MTTFTDKELIKEIKERISSLDVRDNIERRAYEIALASLEADPVAYIFKHPAGKLFWALTDESNKEQSDVIPVYAAPPVPVVPEEKPMPNPLKMYAVDAVAAIAEVRGWNACRWTICKDTKTAWSGLHNWQKPIIRKQVTGCTTTQSILPGRFAKVLICLLFRLATIR